MDAESTRSERFWQGSVRVLGDYDSGVASSYNSLHVTHYSISGSFEAPPPPTHWTCPRRGDRGFVPQEESIKSILSRPSKTLAGLRDNDFDGIAFYGPSGVGKTQVAIQFIEKYRWHTYDVFWVDASTPTTFAKDFQHISDLLKTRVSSDAGTRTNFSDWVGGDTLPSAKPTDKRPPIPEDPTDETAAIKNNDGSTVANSISSQKDPLSAVKSELESRSESTRGWLLVLDNLTDETAITKFLPKCPNGIVIVTTRSLHLASGMGCLVVEVPRMSPTNAALLLEIKYSSPRGSARKRDEVMELVELLEYLPARIADAALHMSENRVSVEEYMAELKAARRLAERSSRPWRRLGLDGMHGSWNGAVVATAWGCFVLFSVLCAWVIGFREG